MLIAVCLSVCLYPAVQRMRRRTLANQRRREEHLKPEPRRYKDYRVICYRIFIAFK